MTNRESLCVGILVDDRCCCEAKQYDFVFFNTKLIRVLNLLLYLYHSKMYVICVGRGLGNVVITCVRSL